MARRARVIRLAACYLARRSMRAVSAMVSLFAAMRGAGLTAACGDGRVAERDAWPCVAGVVLAIVACVGGGVREADVAAQVVADRCPAQLGKGGPGLCAGRRVPGPGLGLAWTWAWAWAWSQPSRFFPVLNVSSRGEHRIGAVLHVPGHPVSCGATYAVASRAQKAKIRYRLYSASKTE